MSAAGVVTVNATAPSLEQRRTALRKRIQTAVGRCSRVNGVEHRHIHFALNQACGDPSINEASIASLEKRLALLSQTDTSWLMR